MENKNPIKNNPDKDLSKSSSKVFKIFQIRGGRFEKGLFIALILVVVIILPLSIWQFNKNLKKGFIMEAVNANTNSSDQLADTTDIQIPILENLRELDTDGDGLNDYDELYRYKTSPYIRDSDSDSILDNIEVEQGTNPNCPTGTTCGREELDTTEEGDTTSSEISEEDVNNLSVEQLRQIMIDAGAPEDQVYQISEEDLRATYQEILAEETAAGDNTNSSSEDILNLGINNTNSDETSIYSTLDYETLINLQPAEIRQLLIEGGVTAEELAGVDDETLKEIYKESLNQNFSELSQ